MGLFGRSKAPTKFHAEIVGLDNYLRAMSIARAVAAEKFLEADNRVAAIAVVRTKPYAPGKTGNAIRSKGPIYEVGRNPPYAISTFLGADNRYGWYAADQYKGSPARQYQPFIGLNYVPGGNTGKRPYYIGEELDKIVDDVNGVVPKVYGEAIDDLMRPAYF